MQPRKEKIARETYKKTLASLATELLTRSVIQSDRRSKTQPTDGAYKEGLAASRRPVKEAPPWREDAKLPVVVGPPEVPRQLEDVPHRLLK